MQTMPDAMSLRDGRSVSMGALLALGGGLALYQMTSLVLGPDGSRQLPLSLSIPVTQVEEPSDQVASNVDLVLGTLVSAAPVAAAPVHQPLNASSVHPSARPASPPRGTTPSPVPTAAPVTTPAPTAMPHPLPPALRPIPTLPPLPVTGDD